MKYHPASLMLRIWLVCIAAFLLLPFQLESRELTFIGFMYFGLFLFAFCAGALIKAPVMKQRAWNLPLGVDFSRSDLVLLCACTIAIVVLGWELRTGEFLDLAMSYETRSDRAGALLSGGESESSIFFQIGFLFYPAGFAYIVREMVFRQKPKMGRLAFFGILPILMASLAMGGRSPLLYAVLTMVFSFRLRRVVFPKPKRVRNSQTSQRNFLMGLGMAVFGLVSLNYFVKVFLVRAQTAGGVGAMFDFAAINWGVSFDGPGSTALFALLGEGNTYLVFVFAWYAVQGLVMANILFTDYIGPPHLGIYGIDLAAAVMRRVNGDFVAERFDYLLSMNTYGFLPSAFGSLYVDFKLWGVVVCFFWGLLAAAVYRQTRLAENPRWLLLAPFVTIGIISSLINTPIGFSNGLVTHFWAIVAFLACRRAEQPYARPPAAWSGSPAVKL